LSPYCSQPNVTVCITGYKDYDRILKIIENYEVDLFIGAHVHQYQRMGPIKNNKLAEFGSLIDPDPTHKYVVDAQAPVYIVEGLPGNHYSYD